MFYGELEAESERLASNDATECETYYLRFGGESSNTVKDRMIATLSRIMEEPVLTFCGGSGRIWGNLPKA